MPTLDDLGRADPAQGLRPRATKENDVTLLSQELSRERIRDLEHELAAIELAARVRARRRARRDAQVRVARVRRILLAR
ncbi:hypothetical protein J4573_45980 [Actinomadura barringtoniae]|uniref:Uncharacterized protein n=1 Tax=Actinomadura barringtoniae TaxID=1427535 RepID=A0A939PLH2_9ACTN|nr:hypothetical protein [Actinomadura barringtoniae]MBO2454505.1 hypothetical protein [Actinomadura barringtoniae]